MVAPRMLCNSEFVASCAKEIINEGGEGIILRRVGSLYSPGRSSDLIKLKATAGDAEAMVIGKEQDDSLILRLPDGTVFPVPSHSIFISDPIEIGDIVSFSYESHSRREIPTSPKVTRIRTDLSWADVVHNTNDLGHNGMQVLAKPLGYWTMKNMRLFMENFARERNLDPLHPETWYTIPRSDILSIKGARAVFGKIKGGYHQVLLELFPDIGLDLTKFRSYPFLYWDNIENRRRFFEEYAQGRNFDPLNPQNWYSQSVEDIMSNKAASKVMSYHNGNVWKALIDLFPNISLDVAILEPLAFEVATRRKFFEDYAKKNSFDPNVPENWYKQDRDKIMSEKGAKGVMAFHNRSVAKALTDLFPHIGLEKSKFPSLNGVTEDTERQKKFFEDYAKANGFDPRNPENWYKQPRDKILSAQGAWKVLLPHKGSISQALVSLFDDIGLDKRKFHSIPQWYESKNRKQFFVDYAKSQGFDPYIPENWYSQPREKIMGYKGAESVLSYHEGSIKQALLDLFPDIALDPSKFPLRPQWNDIKIRKIFFENFAKENNFDPLVADAWYAQQRKLMLVRGASSVLARHKGSVGQALLDLFPNVELNHNFLLQVNKPA